MSDAAVGRLYRRSLRFTRRAPRPHIFCAHGRWLVINGGTTDQRIAAQHFSQRLNDERTPA